MRKFILAFGILAMTMSCSSNEKSADDITIDYSKAAEHYVETEGNDVVADAGSVDGLTLIEGSDCLACHKTDTRLIGPSYQEVAEKYTEADIDMLAQKIMEGGSGNWGEIPMTPHPDVNKESARNMVKYILSLKN
ncbi:MAG: c-type cytochrome [Weeksellaceae bacterium]